MSSVSTADKPSIDDIVEYVSLENVLSRAFHMGHIDDVEYRTAICNKSAESRRNAIYQLLLTKNRDSAVFILDTLRHVMDTSSRLHFGTPSDLSNHIIQPANPMMNDTVVKVLFGFLKVADIKRCRLVCRKWNGIVEPILRKRTKIVFKSTNPRNSANFFSPSMFLEIFKYSLPLVPFTSFSFRGKWPVESISNFFEAYGESIEELELRSTTIKRLTWTHVNNFFMSYDISHWLANSKLKKLTISDCTTTKMFVSMTALIYIEELNITDTVIIVPGEIEAKIVPTLLYLNDINVAADMTNWNEGYLMDGIFDFKKAKRIKIIKNHSTGFRTQPILDLSMCQVEAEYVVLCNVSLLNWELSKWKIDKLSLTGISYHANAFVSVKQLDFAIGRIELNSLPQTLERLAITHLPLRLHLTCSPPINLPNLKFLYLGHAGTLEYSFLFHFTACPNLEELEIHGPTHTDSSYALQINIKWIPRSIIKLKLGGQVEIIGANSRYVNHVVLDKCSVETISRLVTKLRWGRLVIKWNDRYDQIDNKLVPLIRHSKDLSNFVIGVFKWNQCDSTTRKYRHRLEDTTLMQMVDKKAQCYSFINKFGISITCDQFHKML